MASPCQRGLLLASADGMLRMATVLALWLTSTVGSAHYARATTLETQVSEQPGTACVTGGSVLCLGAGGRYRVRTEWRLSDGAEGVGSARDLTTDTGAFTFFDEANLEVVVKILDGCEVNGKIWVFAAGLTDTGVVLVVRDLQTDQTVRYVTTAGSPFQPIRDVEALAGCELNPQRGGLADRIRKQNFLIGSDQTTGDRSGRATCNPGMGRAQWRAAMDFAQVDGASHEIWRVCTCPQIEGECRSEATVALEELDQRRREN